LELLSQSLVRGPPVEAVQTDPGPELLELLAEIIDVVGAVEGFDDLDQPPLEAEGFMVLSKLHEGPGASAIPRRDGWPAACADRVAAGGLQQQDVLHPHVVAPAVGEVVFVHEALANPVTEIGE
jgi:hypothetical protein